MLLLLLFLLLLLPLLLLRCWVLCCWIQVETDKQWQDATAGREWDLVTWIEKTAEFLIAKMQSGRDDLEAEGAHGFW